jgi:hypothetical protein
LNFLRSVFFQILQVRAINNAGQVAFFGDEPQNNFSQVFRGDGISMSDIALVGPDFSALASLDMGRGPVLETLAIKIGPRRIFGEKTAKATKHFPERRHGLHEQ